MEDNRLIICENCGLPIETVDDFGTEENGNRSTRFCQKCYEKGEFTGLTMTPEQIKELVSKRLAGQSKEYVDQLNRGLPHSTDQENQED